MVRAAGEDGVNLAPDHRRRELATIHILAKQLGMDPADKNPASEYRSMLWSLGRERSAANLDYAARRRVIDHMVARGARILPAKRPRAKDPAWDWVNNAAPAKQAMLRKIAVMLKQADREKAYADAVARNMFKVDRIEFCRPDQLHQVVKAFVYDQRRRAEREAR
jgi:phage gp16-like protein